MKRIKLVNRIAVFAVLVFASSSCNSNSSNVAPTPSPSQAQAPPRCTLAAGNMWPNVKLYQDSACQQPFAKIVSANRSEVIIQFDSGEVETKARDVVKKEAYVMTNDPAMP